MMILPLWAINTILVLYTLILFFAILESIRNKEYNWFKSTLFVIVNIFIPLFPIFFLAYSVLSKRKLTIK